MEEALARAEDASIPGPVVNLTDLDSGKKLVNRPQFIYSVGLIDKVLTTAKKYLRYVLDVPRISTVGHR